MMKSVGSAIENNVSIGAHPGYPDREGFGRSEMKMNVMELRAMILYQVGALKAITEAMGGRLNHVKPHGALYNSAAKDFGLSMIIAEAVRSIDSSLILVGLSGSESIRAASETGLPHACEVFADRAYNDDGSLVSRKLPGSVIDRTDLVIERAIRMIREREVITITGRTISLQADTICIHGDNEKAPEFAKSIRDALRENNIEVVPMRKG